MSEAVSAREILEKTLEIGQKGGWAPKGEYGDRFNPDTKHCLVGAIHCAHGMLHNWERHSPASGSQLLAANHRIWHFITAVQRELFPGRSYGGSPFYDHPDTTTEDVELVLKHAIQHAREADAAC